MRKDARKEKIAFKTQKKTRQQFKADKMKKGKGKPQRKERKER